MIKGIISKVTITFIDGKFKQKKSYNELELVQN